MSDHDRKLIALGAVAVIVGSILSGPPLAFVVHLLKPQPPWVDAATFAANYHWLQSLPYWCGFLLLAGNALFVVAAGRLPALRDRPNAPAALVALAIYGTMASCNYAIQVTYLPQARALAPDIVAALNMVNPGSVCWSVEMFSYGFLGVAVWLVAPGFTGTRLLDAARRLLVVDGITSVLGMPVTAGAPQWVLSLPGLAAYVAWNLLVVAAMALVIAGLRWQGNAERGLRL